MVVKTIFYSLPALIRKILFLPLENKIHIFALPCNILHACTCIYVSYVLYVCNVFIWLWKVCDKIWPFETINAFQI